MSRATSRTGSPSTDVVAVAVAVAVVGSAGGGGVCVCGMRSFDAGQVLKRGSSYFFAREEGKESQNGNPPHALGKKKKAPTYHMHISCNHLHS